MGKNFSALSLGILSAAIVFAAVAVFAWTEPGSTPPNNNVAAPVNIGSATQTKSGNFNVTGSMGVGTASPAQKLDVAGTAKVDYIQIDPQDGTNEGGEMQFSGAGSYGAFQIDNYQGNARIHTLASGKTFQVLGGSIYANGSAANYFNGRVGAGNSNPATRLHVGDGGDGSANGITINSTYPTIYFRDADNRSSMIHVNGNLMYFLRGCDNASDPYSGNSWCAYNGRWPLYMNMENNDAVFGGNVYGLAFYYNSDARLKKDIAPISDGLQKVEDLNGVYFKWRDSGEDSIGLIAQDVEKVFPEAVATDDKTGLKSVDYSKLVAPLIEAVKSQQEEIEVLNSRIGDLESKIELMSK